MTTQGNAGCLQVRKHSYWQPGREEERRWTGKVKSCGPHWDGRGSLRQWNLNCAPLINILGS